MPAAPGTTTREPVPVTITTRPLAQDEVEIIDDLDEIVESVMCSCSAGDDQPY
ncbi:hypothetical protein [Streptomyces phytophilus]|uniref:hypothetical protein n=1 Tax=Streptomyces phytophilus TaxID=722715 RepID=UPI0015F0448E|nr:hypothetical protein [Streptomyces phytophilus]